MLLCSTLGARVEQWNASQLIFCSPVSTGRLPQLNSDRDTPIHLKLEDSAKVEEVKMEKVLVVEFTTMVTKRPRLRYGRKPPDNTRISVHSS